MSESWSNRREIGGIAVILLLFGLVVWASHRHGVPDPLPDIALGWALVLHVERAVVLLGAAGAVVLIGWRAVRGDLPIRFGQIEYAIAQATDETTGATVELKRRIALLEDVSGIGPSGEQAEKTEHP